MGPKVGVHGYGTIGKRVADAILKQKDITLVGVTKRTPDYVAKIASSKGLKIYVPSGKEEEFESRGIKVAGTYSDLFSSVDLIVDCTPGGVGEKNKEEYVKRGIKAIFQGGEEHSVSGFSFNAYVNYDDARGKDFVRVVSCNTTALLRTLYAISQVSKIENVFAAIVRRATDPNDSKKGPINAIEPSIPVPSHHGPDVQTVMPIKISTMAVKVPTTLMHVHMVRVKTFEKVSKEDVLEAFRGLSRILVLPGKLGLKSTAQIIEMTRDFGRSRYDLYEIFVWEDSISVEGNVIYYYQAVHQEADVVPENVDAIRAMFELEEKWKSIEKTDKSLGIGKLSEAFR